MIKREPPVEIIHGKPIKKLRVDLKGKNDALDFQDDLADLFALKSGTDMLTSLITSTQSTKTAEKSDKKQATLGRQKSIEKINEVERPYSPTYVASPPRQQKVLERQDSTDREIRARERE